MPSSEFLNSPQIKLSLELYKNKINSRNAVVNRNQMNGTLITFSGNANCVLLTVAGTGTLTQSQCSVPGVAYAICEFVDGATTDGNPCTFPFKLI